ncbi:MAG: replication restart helicase PriA [Helicobacteraceae bacterium]
MNYYEVAVLKRAINPLIYCSELEVRRGAIVRVRLHGKACNGVLLRKVAKPDFACLEILGVSSAFFPSAYLDFAVFISQYYVEFLGKTLGLFEPFYVDPNASFGLDLGANPSASKDLAQDLRGYLGKDLDAKLAQDRLDPSAQPPKIRAIKTNVKLSAIQQSALEFTRSHATSLLFADTGSGKTEIYIKAIEETLNAGKTALFLMPEIALTPQMTARLERHFGAYLGVWHSKISKPQKQGILNAIALGAVRVVIGARSALFLPMPRLGLIIVDEEHDDSYKSEQEPRYNARDLSVYLAKLLNIRAILGSATPSMTSYSKFPTFRIRGQYFKSTKRFVFMPHSDKLCAQTVGALRASLEAGNKAIVFVPTRANYKTLFCKDCGAKVMCPHCSVSLSLHTKSNSLRCHYCGYASKILTQCEFCGGKIFEAKRIGTAQIAADLSAGLEGFRVEQLDKDAASTQNKLERRLKSFANGEIDCLVGTQMLSKGHDYHSIQTAVITGIDYILNSFDYRAQEKALSLLLQVAGRAGRNGAADIIVLTDNKDFFARFINDYEPFLQEGLRQRSGLYPPSKKLARIIVSNKDEKRAKDHLSRALASVSGGACEIVGSGECLSYKLGGKFRHYVLLRSHSSKNLSSTAALAYSNGVTIDIDPIDFY